MTRPWSDDHTGYIIPNGRYFLNRFRWLLKRCEKYGTQHLNVSEKEGVKLWIRILEHISQVGISINNITFTKPTVTLWTDACEHGLGGYDDTGVAWRLEIPIDLQGIFTINLLEFIASYFGIRMAALHHPTQYLRLMAYTDSSSALGWLYKASFDPVKRRDGRAVLLLQ